MYIWIYSYTSLGAVLLDFHTLALLAPVVREARRLVNISEVGECRRYNIADDNFVSMVFFTSRELCQ